MTYISQGYHIQNGEFTVPANAAWMHLFTDYGSGGTYAHDISINHPSSDHDYHAYNGRSISISLGSTIYSGTVDVVTGVVTVEKGIADLGSLSYIKEQATAGTYGRFYTAGLANVIKKQEGTLNLICTSYRPYSTLVDILNSTDGIWLSSAGNLSITSAGYEIATSADFKTAMNGVQLVYELAEPFTIQLPPQEVQSLAGDNVLFSDTNGDLTVEYRSN